jgi:GT2 family glycosyltransferase
MNLGPSPPRVTVVVVNFNGADCLPRCLESLRHQTYPRFSTIVVDNASVDGSADGLESSHPGVRVIRSPITRGFAGGNNLAFREIDDGLVALLNPDAVAAPDWLERLVEAAIRHPEHAMFGCRMLADVRGERLDGVGDVYHVSGLPWREGHGEPAAGRYLQPREIFAPSAAAALYRREVLVATGGFDEDFFCYVEDVDIAFRARLAGLSAMYVPDAVVMHEGSAVVGRHSDFQVYHGHRNLVWVFLRNMPWPLLLVYLPLHLAMTLVTIAVFASRGRAAVLLRAKRDALRGLPTCLAKRRATQKARSASAAALRAVMRRGVPRRRSGDGAG